MFFYFIFCATIKLCMCVTTISSDACGIVTNHEIAAGIVYKELKPSGYLQCQKACKLSTGCATIVYDKELLYCGLVKMPGTAFSMDVSSLDFGACASKVCQTNEVCTVLESGSAVCVNAVSCSTGWTHFNNKCYVASSDPAKWTDGRDKCTELGGSLATVESEDMNAFITTITSSGVFWVGGNDIQTEGAWTWVEDGSSIAYATKWYLGAPQAGTDDADCLGITSGGEWRDVPCHLPATYICQTNIYQ